MEKTDTTTCLKKKNKDRKNIRKIITRLKSLKTVKSKIVF